MAFETFFSLLESADASGSRSSALRPLGWLNAITAALIAVSAKFAPSLLLPLFWVFVVEAAAYIICYGFFMVTDPNALRSERFNLRRMELQQSRTGDDLAGFSSHIEPSLHSVEMASLETESQS